MSAWDFSGARRPGIWHKLAHPSGEAGNRRCRSRPDTLVRNNFEGRPHATRYRLGHWLPHSGSASRHLLSMPGRRPPGARRLPRHHRATRPPLLFKEGGEPPFEGERNDVNQRFTPAVVTNERIEAKLYGTDSKVIRAAQHEGRIDLWTGMATSPSPSRCATSATSRLDRPGTLAVARSHKRHPHTPSGRETGRRDDAGG